MPISALRRVILAKIETTSGTDAAPTAAADAVLVRDITPQEPISVNGVDRPLIRTFLGNFEQLQGAAFMKLSLELELAGFGTAGPTTPTKGYDALLRCCGLSSTVTAGTNVLYAPVSTGFETATIYFYNDGKLYKGVGVAGDLTITMNVGEIPVYKIDLTGVFVPVTDTAIVTPTVTAYQRPVLVNSTNTSGVSVHGFAAVLNKFEFKLGNQIETRELVGAAPRVLITGRQAEGNIEIEDTLVASKDWLTLVQNATLGAFSITHGPAANRVTFASSRMQLINPKQTDVQNIVHNQFDVRFVPSAAGNDDFTITVL